MKNRVILVLFVLVLCVYPGCSRKEPPKEERIKITIDSKDSTRPPRQTSHNLSLEKFIGVLEEANSLEGVKSLLTKRPDTHIKQTLTPLGFWEITLTVDGKEFKILLDNETGKITSNTVDKDKALEVAPRPLSLPPIKHTHLEAVKRAFQDPEARRLVREDLFTLSGLYVFTYEEKAEKGPEMWWNVDWRRSPDELVYRIFLDPQLNPSCLTISGALAKTQFPELKFAREQAIKAAVKNIKIRSLKKKYPALKADPEVLFCVKHWLWYVTIVEGDKFLAFVAVKDGDQTEYVTTYVK